MMANAATCALVHSVGNRSREIRGERLWGEMHIFIILIALMNSQVHRYDKIGQTVHIRHIMLCLDKLFVKVIHHLVSPPSTYLYVTFFPQTTNQQEPCSSFLNAHWTYEWVKKQWMNGSSSISAMSNFLSIFIFFEKWKCGIYSFRAIFLVGEIDPNFRTFWKYRAL